MQIQDSGPSSRTHGSRVWIIDRNRLFLEGMLLLLADSALSVELHVTNLEDMETHAHALEPPDVVLIGINTPLRDHGEDMVPLEDICARFAGIPVVMLGDLMSMEQLKAAMKSGASGYLLRNISADALKHSLALAIAGEKVLPSELVGLIVSERSFNRPLRAAETAHLSVRERAILRCLAGGSSNKQIANELNIAEGTVKVHIKAVFKKVGARNRTDAAVWALNNAPQIDG